MANIRKRLAAVSNNGCFHLLMQPKPAMTKSFSTSSFAKFLMLDDHLLDKWRTGFGEGPLRRAARMRSTPNFSISAVQRVQRVEAE